VRREVIAARGVVTILLIFNSLLYDHLNAINFQINESHELLTQFFICCLFALFGATTGSDALS
jgi:hypothetical protein